MPLYKQTWVWIILIAVILGGGILLFGDNIELSSVTEEDVALRIDGSVITKEKFFSYVDQVIGQYQMFGMEIDEKEVLDNSIEFAVEEFLLFNFIDEKEIEISNEEIVSFYEDEKRKRMEFAPESEFPTFEEIKEDIEKELQIKRLIEMYKEEVNINEEDLREVYDNQVAQMEMMEIEDIPSFDEMSNDIRNQLLEEEAITIIREILTERREEIDLEILVDVSEIKIPERGTSEFETNFEMIEEDELVE